MDFVPTKDEDEHSSISSLMLLKVDLGFKEKGGSGDEEFEGQSKEAINVSDRCVGFLTNINSSQNINHLSENYESKLSKKLKPIIENFKRANIDDNDAVKESNEESSHEHETRNEKILFSVIAGKLPMHRSITGKVKIKFFSYFEGLN